MTDDVLAVKYSPDGKLLAVSLLDSTVKIFLEDSLKFFLSLYGHKVRLHRLGCLCGDRSCHAASGTVPRYIIRLEDHRDVLGR